MTNTQHYADFEIRTLEHQDAGYSVEVTLDGEQEFQCGFLTADRLPWTPTGDSRADGERLFVAMYSDVAICKAWERACGQHPQRRLRHQLDTIAPELRTLPAEP